MATQSTTNMRPRIWAATLLTQIEEQSVFLGLCNRDYEGDVRAYGDSVQIGRYDATVTVRDYTEYTDIADPQNPTTEDQLLNIDQKKYWNVAYDAVHRRQTKPDLWIPHLARAGAEIAGVIDSFVANYIGATSVINTARDVVIGSSTNKADAADGSDSKITNVAKTFLKSLADMETLMREANIWNNGGTPWIVITPKILGLLTKYFAITGSPHYETITSQTVRNGFVGNLMGFDFRVSNLLEPGANKINTVADRYVLPVGTSRAATFAGQLTQIRFMQQEKRIGDKADGLYVYGGKVVDPRFLYHIDAWLDLS